MNHFADMRNKVHLTRRERLRAGWYAAIILIPLAAILLAHHLYGPSLGQVMGW